MLDSTAESVTSALKRARASLQHQRSPTDARDPAPAPDSPSERALVAEFVRAYESADLDAAVALLPTTSSCRSRRCDSNTRARRRRPLLRRNPPTGPRFDLVPTRANGQPAFGTYLRAPNGIRHGTGLFVLTLTSDRICAMTRFENSAYPWFGLPHSFPS